MGLRVVASSTAHFTTQNPVRQAGNRSTDRPNRDARCSRTGRVPGFAVSRQMRAVRHDLPRSEVPNCAVDARSLSRDHGSLYARREYR
jgi:hypothetical protein